MKFKLSNYEVGLDSNGREIMIVELHKATEKEKSGLLVEGKQGERFVGIAGSMKLHVYETRDQERFKKYLGKDIEVDIKL